MNLSSDLTKMLQGLVSQRFLTQDGRGRWTEYYLPPFDDSIHKETDSIHKETDSIHKKNNLVHKEQITADQLDILNKIANPAQISDRLPLKHTELSILKLCQNHWLSRKELSDLLHRDSDGLRSRFLTPMVKKGILRK